jgi:hypothetical protein
VLGHFARTFAISAVRIMPIRAGNSPLAPLGISARTQKSWRSVPRYARNRGQSRCFLAKNSYIASQRVRVPGSDRAGHRLFQGRSPIEPRFAAPDAIRNVPDPALPKRVMLDLYSQRTSSHDTVFRSRKNLRP